MIRPLLSLNDKKEFILTIPKELFWSEEIQGGFYDHGMYVTITEKNLNEMLIRFGFGCLNSMEPREFEFGVFLIPVLNNGEVAIRRLWVVKDPG